MLPKLLDRIIKPYIPNIYLLRSTKHFIDNLKQDLCLKNDTIVSFDVVISLFTNVPRKETIEIVIYNMYANTASVMPVGKKIFRKLTYLATQGIFMFNQRFFKEVDCVIMGNLLDLIELNFSQDIYNKRYLQIWLIIVVCCRKFIQDISTMCTLFFLIQILALVL